MVARAQSTAECQCEHDLHQVALHINTVFPSLPKDHGMATLGEGLGPIFKGGSPEKTENVSCVAEFQRQGIF